jgi:hypothetical protein
VKSIFKFLALFSLVTVLVGSQVVLSILVGNYIWTIISGAEYLLFTAILYVTYVRKRKKQYPQVLLDGYDDIYFPRTTIPRPLYRDVKQHRKYFEKKEDEQTQAQA